MDEPPAKPADEIHLSVEVAEPPMVAVLLSLNTTGDQEFEYLADGVTDNLINT